MFRMCYCTSWQLISLHWRHNGHGGVSNHQPHDCLLNRLFGRRSKKTSKLRVTGLCAGNSPGTGEFPARMASNAENVSIWWRHHVHELIPAVWDGVTYLVTRIIHNQANMQHQTVFEWYIITFIFHFKVHRQVYIGSGIDQWFVWSEELINGNRHQKMEQQSRKHRWKIDT